MGKERIMGTNFNLDYAESLNETLSKFFYWFIFLTQEESYAGVAKQNVVLLLNSRLTNEPHLTAHRMTGRN